MKILLLHGWQSIPGGVKPTFLAQHGHEVVNPKLPDDDFEEPSTTTPTSAASFCTRSSGTTRKIVCHPAGT